MNDLKIGFIGIGSMGEPMALNLLKSGVDLKVWNRTIEKCEILREVGATVCETKQELFLRCDIIFLMLADSQSMDAVLERGNERFQKLVAGKMIVNNATVEPTYSKLLASDILRCKGQYVEAPVSGSKKPAENATLLVMVAGSEKEMNQVKPYLSMFSKSVIECGNVPNALLMKYAVNIFLITTVTGLAESIHFAQIQGVDQNKLLDILDQSQMASDISRVKTSKIRAHDFLKQASIADVLKNNQLITDSAIASDISLPLMNVCGQLYQETQDAGLAQEDMIAVIKAIETRTFGANTEEKSL